MTEYTTSSQAYREFMSARERTAYWVQSHAPYEEGGLYSPSVPPSVLDGLVPSSPPSEADSSHSTPPKMVLRYNDGRPDVPIPRQTSARSSSTKQNLARSHTVSYNQPLRSGSGSSGDAPSAGSHSRPYDRDARAPEEIRVLPTYGDAPSPTSSRPSHIRSKSLPRRSDHAFEPVPQLPLPPQNQGAYYPPHVSGNHHPPGAPHQPGISFAPPAQWPPRNPNTKHPPAIIYAPSHHTQRPHYAPPAMFHHPPQMGPNGMIYSHSAPVPGQYPPAYPTPYPSATSHRHTSSAHDVRTNPSRGRMRSLGRSARNPTTSSESLESEKSGSTYYVLPAHGQKVHVISPSPEQSIVTATSTTKSPTSPYSFHGKKPFFRRLFDFSVFSHGSSRASSNGHKLHRRHSIGEAGPHRDIDGDDQ